MCRPHVKQDYMQTLLMVSRYFHDDVRPWVPLDQHAA